MSGATPSLPSQRRSIAWSTGRRGFTLLELLIAFAISASLMLLAVPMYAQWIGDEKVMNHARLLAKSMQHARSEAIKRGHRVNLCKSADGVQCADTGTWDQGFLMHEDTGNLGEVDGGDSVIRVEPPNSEMRVAANKTTRRLRLLYGFRPRPDVERCAADGHVYRVQQGLRAVDVVLVGSGRVRIARSKTVCP